jgi:hypothetical protein
MNTNTNTEAADTVQTGSDQAVAQERLVSRSFLMRFDGMLAPINYSFEAINEFVHHPEGL